ncbi:MAG TPA: hypothetical protein VGP12_04425 [Nitrosospira sp.]|jgi:hypothetical protein|nr:hypothetical protein [Nitrosospira sp.]
MSSYKRSGVGKLAEMIATRRPQYKLYRVVPFSRPRESAYWMSLECRVFRKTSEGIIGYDRSFG